MKKSGISGDLIRNWTLAIICWIAFLPLWANDSGLLCTVEDQGEQAQFFCLDVKERIAIVQKVDHLNRFFFSDFLAQQGVEILEPTEYLRRTLLLNLQEFQLVGKVENCSDLDSARAQKVYFRPHEIPTLGNNPEVFNNLKKLALALQNAGVCKDLGLPTGRNRNIRQIDIRSKDDILQHFLCISNSESVFGLRNIGQGGRGPFGINPDHTEPNGICSRDAKNAIVRNSKGGEIKDSKRYITDHTVLQDNAKCATILYREANFFESWGNDNVAWGSNRHCSATVRRSINFPKLLGPLACCTPACKKGATQSASL